MQFSKRDPRTCRVATSNRLRYQVLEAVTVRDGAGTTARVFSDYFRRKMTKTGANPHIQKQKKKTYTRVGEKFLDDLPKMMYGFGDVPEPFQESKQLLNQMIEEYIKSFVTDAMAGKVDKKLSPSMLKFRIKNPQKRKRIDELLMMNEELRDAKALSVSE